MHKNIKLTLPVKSLQTSGKILFRQGIQLAKQPAVLNSITVYLCFDYQCLILPKFMNKILSWGYNKLINDMFYNIIYLTHLW
jgi:hypothetical protein